MPAYRVLVVAVAVAHYSFDIFASGFVVNSFYASRPTAGRKTWSNSNNGITSSNIHSAIVPTVIFRSPLHMNGGNIQYSIEETITPSSTAAAWWSKAESSAGHASGPPPSANSLWFVPLLASVSVSNPGRDYSIDSDGSNDAHAELIQREIQQSVSQSVRHKLQRVTQGHRIHAERNMKLLDMEIELAQKSEHALRRHLFRESKKERQDRDVLLSQRLLANRQILMECLERNTNVVEQLLDPKNLMSMNQCHHKKYEQKKNNCNRDTVDDTDKIFTDIKVVQTQESGEMENTEPSENDDMYWGSGGVADGKSQSKETEGYDTALQVITHTARDWTLGAESSRDATNGWIVRELQSWWNSNQNGVRDNHQGHGKPISVLVPGAGLGRLAFDISTTGTEMAVAVDVEANDSSAIMAVASHNVLQLLAQKALQTLTASSSTTSNARLHPFVSDPKTNEINSQKRFDVAVFPDEKALETLRHFKSQTGTLPQLSYRVGDFVATYSSPSEKGKFDAIATSFFVDTATNIYEYVAIMKHLLRRSSSSSSAGSVWINVGPVQWHPCALLRPTVGELRDILIESGFHLLKWEVASETVCYRHSDDGGMDCEDPRYTRSEAYRPLRFVAVLKGDGEANQHEQSDEDVLEDLPLHLSIEYCEYINRVSQGRE